MPVVGVRLTGLRVSAVPASHQPSTVPRLRNSPSSAPTPNGATPVSHAESDARGLPRVMFFVVPRHSASHTCPDRCRVRGMPYFQTLLRLARRRISMLFAVFRSRTCHRLRTLCSAQQSAAEADVFALQHGVQDLHGRFLRQPATFRHDARDASPAGRTVKQEIPGTTRPSPSANTTTSTTGQTKAPGPDQPAVNAPAEGKTNRLSAANAPETTSKAAATTCSTPRSGSCRKAQAAENAAPPGSTPTMALAGCPRAVTRLIRHCTTPAGAIVEQRRCTRWNLKPHGDPELGRTHPKDQVVRLHQLAPPEGAGQDYAHQDKPTTDSSHPVGPRAGARCCPVAPGPGLRLRPDIGGALSQYGATAMRRMHPTAHLPTIPALADLT